MEKMWSGEHWKSQPEHVKKIEKPKSPENTVEKEPKLYRRLKVKNELVSKLYHYASGGTHTNPLSSISTPKDAMSAYLKLTGGDEVLSIISGPLTPVMPLPPTEEILQTDPFANDSLRLTPDERKAATYIGFSISRRSANATKISSLLDFSLSKFIEDFSKLDNVSKIDKDDVSDSSNDSRLRKFRESVAFLLARFIALKAKEKFPADEELKSVVENGLHAYKQTFFNDIPYYDKVYEYFDDLRKKGRNPQEVYLGRDGMYASIGRRSQDLSKRRKAGKEKRVSAKKAGEPMEIKTKYLVYPRFYRDQLTRKTKKLYLESQGVTSENDPIFFDTGFAGTVPEQILDILGFSEEEKNKRIKMLSANCEERRIPGISPSERHKIVDLIEYNVKPEEPSSGIMIDKMGRLKHVAKPTSPEEQFIFEMIRMAIVRHYWLTS